jgi:ketosteroid isomerase-like protein
MSSDQNRSLVRRYYEEVANADTPERAADAADALISEDFVFYPPNADQGVRGLDNHKEFLHWHHGVAPDQRWTPEELIAEADKLLFALRLREHSRVSS